jgi:hypothetical protein
MKKISELSPEEKRILCAEACGWTDGGGVSNWPHYGYRKGAGKPESPEPLPHYDTSLDAMATATATLNADDYERFISIIRLKFDELLIETGTRAYQRAIMDADAETRLDAFLCAKHPELL